MLKPQEKVVAKPGKFVFLMDGLVDGLSKEKWYQFVILSS